MKKTILLLFIISSVLNAVDFGNLLQIEKQKYHAKGVAVVVIDSVNSSGYFVYEDSSEKLAKKFTKNYLFEPGNTIIPVLFALILDKDNKYKETYAKDAIIYSSSKTMDIVSKILKTKDLYNGLKKFGFNHISLKKLKRNGYKQIYSGEFGMQTNLLELTMAYRIFSFPCDIIKKETAKEMKKLLIEAVKKDTGKNAQIKGMLIGGKTGTTLITSRKTNKNSSQYNVIFIGFANGKGHKYTIGVLVINPKIKKLASKSAINIFRDVVKSLLNDPFELGKQEYKKGHIKKAIKLINKACNSGNSLACYNLALLYESGQDVKPNLTKAKKYYKKSCENGFELACRIYKNVY